jgi:hypothetical protein
MSYILVNFVTLYSNLNVRLLLNPLSLCGRIVYLIHLQFRFFPALNRLARMR